MNEKLTAIEETHKVTITASDRVIAPDEPVWIEETWQYAGKNLDEAKSENRSHRYHMGETDIYETWAAYGDKDALLKSLVKQYGGYIGKVYVDVTDGQRVHVGYIFRKRMQYEDTIGNEPENFFIMDTWVEFYHKNESGTFERVKLS